MRIAAYLDRKLEKTYQDRFLDTERELVERSPAAAADRLKLGLEIVEADPNWAVTIAKATLGPTTRLGVTVLDFLYQVSKKDPGLADQFLASVVQNIKQRRGLDINELLLLHSYVTGSSVLPSWSAQGLVSVYVPYKPLHETTVVSPLTRSMFFQVASEILLDGSRYAAGVEKPVWSMEGDLAAIRILEPRLRQWLPQLDAAVLDRQLTLTSYVSTEKRSSMERALDEMRRKLDSEKALLEASSVSADSLIEKAEKTVGVDQRDELYFQAADLAMAKGAYLEAFEITEKLSLPLRESVNDFFLLGMARGKLSDSQFDTAADLAKRISDPTLRVYVLTLLARASINAKSKYPNEATEILAQAEGAVREVKQGAERVSVLAGIGNVYSRIDQNIAYSYLADAVAQCNAVENLSNPGSISRLVRVGSSSFSYSLYGERDLSLWELVVQQSRRDFFSTLFVVDSIKDPLIRIRARIALYRGADSERSE
jgi:tetratricopeptide (TPR) repeat protein